MDGNLVGTEAETALRETREKASNRNWENAVRVSAEGSRSDESSEASKEMGARESEHREAS